MGNTTECRACLGFGHFDCSGPGDRIHADCIRDGFPAQRCTACRGTGTLATVPCVGCQAPLLDGQSCTCGVDERAA